ncbi:MAG: tandem-95 repeat protein [Rhizobiaceae bacterium]
MAGAFQSIFNRQSADVPAPPAKDKPLMRVLEPRVLLDAAATETALDIAGQAAHSQLADDYMSDDCDVCEDVEDKAEGEESPTDDSEVAESLSTTARRTDREVIFIDSDIEDREGLIASLEPGVSIHIIEAGSDGVQQFADILAEAGDDAYDAVHIFSHGAAGALQLGDSVLDAKTITSSHAEALHQIGEALSDSGDILIYGCNFGAGELGQRTAGLLAAATGADIAASDDLTGSESLSGDWDLEVQQGSIETHSFTLPDWQGILPGYELQPTAGPTIGHLDDGIVGTANTTATWSDAVVYDPGGGPVQTFDIRATLIGLSDGMSATFETVASTDGSMDDFRVVVTNIGEIVGSAGGQDIIDEGSVVVRWAIYESGTDTLAPPDQFNLIFKDIEGLAGLPDSRETVAIESEEVVSYTTNSGSDLQVSSDIDGLTATGTQQGTGAVGSDLGLSWVSSNQFVVTYTSRTLITNFDMDGDRDMSAFPTPVTEKTQIIDLNGAAAGENYVATYINGSQMGSDDDVPLSLTDVNMSIFDFDSDFLESATITLTNAQSGDVINFDTTLLSALGISANYTDTGTERILELNGLALISNYETALLSITYSNGNPDGSFDQVTDRVFEFSVFDGVLDSDVAQTTVQFAAAAQTPVAGSNVYVEDEDTTISASVATGLLSNDFDPQGAVLSIIGALDSDSNSISIGSAHTMPSGALLTLNALGDFTYIPPLNYSGNETISYSISDGTYTSTGVATFDIQPVIDPVTLTVVQADAVSDEDLASEPIDVSSLSDDDSETQIILATSIPEGVVLTDGNFSFTSGDGRYDVEITEWDRTQLRVLPVENSDLDIDILFVTENYEVDGSVSFDSQTVTFEVDAVADVPILIVEQAFAGIDENVPLGTVISVDLFDTDGSEEITDISISGIPAGAQMLVDSGPLTITGGVASLQLIDLPGLIFVPPVTGLDAVYNLSVSATATEVSPENGVTLASATRSGIGLTIELNDNDNPVVAVDDTASTFAGESVNIYVLDNDFIPDGAPLVTHINGTPIDTANPVTLPGGQGDVELSPFGYLVFNASDSFAGEVKFSYTAQDADLSTDDGIVTVKIEPRWKMSSVSSVTEGNDARFTLAIEGGVAQGDTISAEVILEEGTTTAADHATLADAINASIVNLGQTDFTFDGTNITYTSPATNYTVDYNAGINTFNDISGTGDSLNLGDNGISGRSLGFDFDFYADNFSSVFVSANGYLTFGSPGADPNNVSLDGSALSGRPVIAPFWDDLDTSAGNVYVETLGSIEGQRQFVVQWEGVQNTSDGAGTGSFQVILDESNNSITFNYQDVTFDGVGDQGAGATIGLQSPDGVADEHSFDTGASVVDGSSITFTREPNTGVEFYIDVPIVDDPTFEDSEDFGLRIISSVNSAIGADNSSVTIAVSDNSAPVAVDDTVATTETTTANINVITNPGGLDSDPEGHSLQISEVNGVVITGGTAVTLASGAIVGVNPDGNLTYNPNGAYTHLAEGEPGVDTFTYKVVDAYGTESATAATVTINITGENQTTLIDLNDDGTTSDTTYNVTYGPLETTMNVAAPDAVLVDVDDTELTSLAITLGGFVQAGNEKLRVNGLTIEYGTPLNSTVTVGGTLFRVVYDGTNDILVTNDAAAEFAVADIQSFVRLMTYENDSSDDFRATRTLSFVATDDDGPGTAAVSEIYVVGNNVAPDAGDDGDPTPYVTVEDTSILITVAELLSNDSDVDLNPLDIIAVNGGANGSAVLDGGGNVIYTPDPDYTGTTFFTYTLDDGEGGQDTGTVHVTVTPVNDAPRLDLNGLQPGIDRTFTYVENDPAASMFLLTGTIVDVDNGNLAGADIVLTNGQIGDVLTFGTLPGGIVATVVPAEAATGLTSAATVTIQLSGTASVADYDTALRDITYSSISETPDVTDRIITMTATDGSLTSVTATVTVEVTSVNDAPDTVADGLFTFDEDASITITPASLLANDNDLDGETLTITSVQSAVNGTVIVNGDGDFVFTSDPDYFGSASFTYAVEDGSGGSATETVSLMVNSVNDAPVISLDTGSGDGSYAFTYTENDPATVVVDATIDLQDIDHPNLASATVSLTNGQIGDILEFGSMPAGITAAAVPATALTSPGTISVTLSGSATQADYEAALQLVTFRSITDAPSVVSRSIDISVNDGDTDSNVGTTTVTVIAVNDAPIAADDNTITFAEDTARVILAAELLGNDVDPDLDTVSIVSVQSSVNGVAVLNGDNTITFTPQADYFGPASFTYTIDDGNGLQDTATVNLTITSVNDLPVIDLDTGSGGTGYSTTYVENAVAVTVVDPTVSITDVDHTNLTGASVSLTNGQIGDLLQVGSLPAGISATVSPATALTTPGSATVTLSGSATLADYQTALQAITYVSISDNPGATTRTISTTVNDGVASSVAAVSSVAVTPVNDAPVAAGDGTYTFDEDTNFVIGEAALLANDSDAENDGLTIQAVQNPVNGTVSLLAGVVTFIPTADYSGVASFEYVVQDGNGGSDTATVTLSVSPVNDAPVLDLDTGAGGTSYNTAYTENGSAVAVVDASVSVTDVDGGSFAGAALVLSNGQVGDILNVGSLPVGITAVVTPAIALTVAGSITVQLSGTGTSADYQTAMQAVTFESQSDDPGATARTVFVSVNDGVTNSATATSTIAVTPVNDAPTAAADGTYTASEDTPFVIAEASLLANDTDPENDPLSILSVQSPVNGTVSLAGGNVTFTPATDYSGLASFTYTVQDTSGATSTAIVNLTVNSINDAPTIDLDAGAGGTGYTTGYVENGTGITVVDASVSLADVDSSNMQGATVTLQNGFAGDLLEVGSLPAGITAVVSPATALTGAGTVTVALSGSATVADYQTALQAVTYRSNTDQLDGTSRSVSVTVTDGSDASLASTTTIAVTPVNDVPVAGADGTYSFNEDSIFTIPNVSLLANDTDLDGDGLSILSVQSPVNGSVVLDGFGNVVFTPTPTYSGPASFTYTVQDPGGATDTATVSLNVLILNDAPIVDLDLSGAGSGFATSYTENGVGIAIVDSDISITDEDHTDAESATITLTNGQIGDLLEVGVLPGGLTAVVSPATALTAPGIMTVTLNGTASLADYQTALQALTYRSTSEDPVTTSREIEFVVSDGEDPSLVTTTSIAITSVNDAPVAADDGVPTALIVTEDVPMTFDPVSSNDSDVEGDALTITEIDGNAIVPGGFVNLGVGRVDLAIDGRNLTYTPALNYFGPASFSYTISDGGLTDTANINFDVQAVNDAPVALDDGPVVLVEDGSVSYDPVLSNDTDVEGDNLTILSINGSPITPTGSVTIASGTITLGADGRTLDYVPNGNFNGLVVVNYVVSDGAASATANVTFDVTALDDPISLISTPPNVTLNDGDSVNLPMAGFFDDPDGDALVYSAAGLPAGITINPTTGLISGTLDAAASQSGPFAVTVTVDDGVASNVSTGFSFDVLNVAPVASPDTSILVYEGDGMNIDTSAMFVDADNDTLTFAASGLPGWASFDTGSGLITGTIPDNASLSGAFIVTINADDGQGGVASVDVTIDPRNVAPVATFSLPELRLQDDDPVDIDVSSLFVDGGLDSDLLTLSVTGMPDGVTFDVATGRISGTIAPGASSGTTYSVSITADDGQGGIAVVGFNILVGNATIVEETNPFASFDDLIAFDEPVAEASTEFDPLMSVIDQIAELNGTLGLDSRDGLLLSAIGEIDPLQEATLAGSDDGMPEQIDAMDKMAVSTDWLRSSGREGNGDWSVAGTFGYMALTDDSEYDGTPERDASLERFSIEAVSRQGVLFIELDNQLDPKRDGRVVTTSFTYEGSDELPEWMKLVREGFITATPPQDLSEVTLGVSIILESGKNLSKFVVIDVQSGAVIELTDEATALIENSDPIKLKKSAGVEPRPAPVEPRDRSRSAPPNQQIADTLEDLRGSIDTLGDR